MQKKYGKFYADWEDENHKRRREAFPTKKAALRFQTRIRSDIAAKKARASAASQTTATPGPRRNTARGRK